jgi:hypothetical protein
MQWQPGPQAGFSTVEPWLPLDPQAQTCNVEVLRDDLVGVPALVDQDVAVDRDRAVIADAQRRMLAAERDQAAGAQRARPWPRPGAHADAVAARAAGGLLHRRAVAAPQGEQQHRRHPGLRVADPGGDAGLVVVAQHPVRVLIGEIYLPLERLVAYYGVDLSGAHLPFNFQLRPHLGDDLHHLGLVGGMELDEAVDLRLAGDVVRVRLVAYYGVDLSGAHLPFNFQLIQTPWHAPALARLIEHRPHLGDDLHHLGLVGGMELDEAVDLRLAGDVVLLIGEIYLPLERLVAYYGVDLSGAHLPFNFQLIQLNGRCAPDKSTP